MSESHSTYLLILRSANSRPASVFTLHFAQGPPWVVTHADSALEGPCTSPLTILPCCLLSFSQFSSPILSVTAIHLVGGVDAVECIVECRGAEAASARAGVALRFQAISHFYQLCSTRAWGAGCDPDAR